MSVFYRGALNRTDIDGNISLTDFPIAGSVIVGALDQSLIPIYVADSKTSGLVYENDGDSSLSISSSYIRGLFDRAPGQTNLSYNPTYGLFDFLASPIFTGITIGSLSGMLKASAGVVSGSGTTSDLTEGSNLYYTDARVWSAISGTAPITETSGVIALSHNTTNLKITSSQLNTIQDIALTSSPQFQGLNLQGLSSGRPVFVDTWTKNLVSTGTVSADQGGTNITSYAVGDLIYATASNILTRFPDVATGNALISGGEGVVPSYGKIGLTTHVSGILPVANGGTGNSTALTNGQLWIGNTGNAPSRTTITGTANQITVTNGAGTITLSTPQNINTTAWPNFSRIQLGTSWRNDTDSILWIEGNAISTATNIYNVLINNAMTTTGGATSINKIAVLGSGTATPGTTGYLRGIWINDSGSSGTFGRRIGLRIENTGWDMGISCGGGATFGYGPDLTKASGEVCISSKLAIGSSTNTNALDVTGIVTTTGQLCICSNTSSYLNNANTACYIGSPTLSTANGASNIGLQMVSYLGSAAGQTGHTSYGQKIYVQTNGWASTGGAYYGLHVSNYSAGAGSMATAITGFFDMPSIPSGGATNKCALYTHSLYVGNAASGNQTAGNAAIIGKLAVGGVTNTNALDVTGLATFSTGIQVGGSPNTLSVYKEVTGATTTATYSGTTATLTYDYVIIGKTVHLKFRQFLKTFTVGSLITFSVASEIYPAATAGTGLMASMPVASLSVYTSGMFLIPATSGTCKIYYGTPFGNFPVAASTGIEVPGVISYNLL